MTIRQDFVYNRNYTGQVKGLILDWSGTTADAYVLAPAVVLVDRDGIVTENLQSQIFLGGGRVSFAVFLFPLVEQSFFVAGRLGG